MLEPFVHEVAEDSGIILLPKRVLPTAAAAPNNAAFFDKVPPEGRIDGRFARKLALSFGSTLVITVTNKGYDFSWRRISLNCRLDRGFGTNRLLNFHGSLAKFQDLVKLSHFHKGYPVLMLAFRPQAFENSAFRYSSSNPCSIKLECVSRHLKAPDFAISYLEGRNS